MKTECWHCGRSKMFAVEGRRANGSWPKDVLISEDAYGQWFCSMGCYNAEIEAEKARKKAARNIPAQTKGRAER